MSAESTALWSAVVASYDEDGLVTLTNIRDRSATTVNTTVGQSAAQAVVDLWPAYAQTTFDLDDPLHMEVGKRATIAVLWSRGGTAAAIAKIEWDEVFSDTGMVARVKATGARGRQGPSTNSGVSTSSETIRGQAVMGWSDRGSIPNGILPERRTASYYDEA